MKKIINYFRKRYEKAKAKFKKDFEKGRADAYKD